MTMIMNGIRNKNSFPAESVLTHIAQNFISEEPLEQEQE